MIGGRKALKVALVGNPNTGKSSLFNALTGLNQKVSNYPGITVEKKSGFSKLDQTSIAEITDLPGTYSLHPSSVDEEVVLRTLTEPNNPDRPDAIVAVADATNLKRNLYLFTQILDLGLPTLLVLNMVDQVRRKGIEIDVEKIERDFGVKVVLVNARKGEGIDVLKKEVIKLAPEFRAPVFDVREKAPNYAESARQVLGLDGDYAAWLVATQIEDLNYIDKLKVEEILQLNLRTKVDTKRLRIQETIQRYKIVNDILKEAVTVSPEKDRSWTGRLDRIITHKVYGVIILLFLLFLIFQAIFSWAELPMNLIDIIFSELSIWVKETMEPGALTSLISDGIIPGVAGVVIFLPQIFILFTFITLMEETGYMARVVFLMDKLMRRFGLSGKSVVPLISGTACAIPAIMATRNIESWKERLITIFVTPFTTCSARLPVYTVLIGLVIPSERYFGVNLQGLVLMFMYLLGFGVALGSAWLMSKLIPTRKTSQFILEMPAYRVPLYKNVLLTIWGKGKAFVTNAGKIIIAISIVLWVMASNGPNDHFTDAEQYVRTEYAQVDLSPEEFESKVGSYRLEHSYIGYLGQAIEPGIRPLGYDWKVGIALISSFAAREVFVGTMATIYSVGSEDEKTVMEYMASEKNKTTGGPFFTLAVGMSLLMFYAFAMQCMSTFAIVKKETNSWRWPIFQAVFMTGFAYVVSLITYQIFS
ncbi:ferrous iron transport protein B [Phaeocystidibacter marisrubri]|uniref:Ferrous iron transport protein B n=1 Tax=Phaeocystidibacter marisrubri TaxID=1577780 RepID=A0A6L3ZH81_9FLAO|nr:ferrous iron transport protein B [Phaeocystidibacter marisrubri]KAB2816979.1 ferrous iron transport protein B [Phaeocystidibacter marisrubri]GGH77351.1 ferrous iron transport protein B [Phaeocystidibacter marisrubri]